MILSILNAVYNSLVIRRITFSTEIKVLFSNARYVHDQEECPAVIIESMLMVLVRVNCEVH